jgi:uncharacterized membrane protein
VNNSKYIVWIALGIILLIAAGLRFSGLEKESLWADELESWRISSVETPGEVIRLCQRDVHPPAYQLFLWVWIKGFGDSPTALRLPSAIFGVLAVGMMFLLGRRWLTDKEALIAAGLMAVLWFAVYYSQESRSYALNLLLSLVSFYAWREILTELKTGKKIPWKWIIGYVFVGALGAYNHYFMLNLLLVQAALIGVYLLGQWKELGIAIGMYLAMALLFIPWMPSFFEDLGMSGFWIPEPGWDFYFQFFRRAFFYHAVLSGCVAALIGMGVAWPDRGEKQSGRERIILIVWALAPFLIAFLKSKIGTPVLTYQNLIITLPALYLLAARGFAAISLPKNLNLWAGGTFVLAALVYLLGIKNYYSTTEKMEYREAVAHVLSAPAPQESSLYLSYDHYPAYFGYYFREVAVKPRATSGEMADWPGVKSMITSSGKTTLFYMVGKLKPEPEFLAAMAKEFELVETVPFREIEVYQYRIPN